MQVANIMPTWQVSVY